MQHLPRYATHYESRRALLSSAEGAVGLDARLGGVPGLPATAPSALELCPSAGVSPRQGHHLSLAPRPPNASFQLHGATLNKRHIGDAANVGFGRPPVRREASCRLQTSVGLPIVPENSSCNQGKIQMRHWTCTTDTFCWTDIVNFHIINLC